MARPGSFRSSMRWAIPSVLAVALGTGLSACSDGQDSHPATKVARQYIENARRGDVEAVMALLERRALERLQDAADQASDQVGGRRSIEPHAMLEIVRDPVPFDVAGVKLVEERGGVARVEIQIADGSTVPLELVNQDGEWKVRVPLPESKPLPVPEPAPALPEASPDPAEVPPHE